MAIMPVQPPKWKADGGSTGVPQIKHTFINQGTGGANLRSWLNGQFLVQGLQGTITPPNPNGSLSLLAGPITFTNSAQNTQTTIGTSAVSGAPSQTYYIAVSYAGAGSIESLTSPCIPFITPAGFVPTVSVQSLGAPAAATGFFTYVGLFPRIWYRQAVATALGATLTLAYPLTNYTGAQPIVAGSSTNILGLALCYSDQIVDPLSAAPGRRNPYGATMSTAPLMADNAVLPYARAGYGTFELNLVQAYSSGLVGVAIGLNIDALTGLPVWDTTQTQCAVITEQAFGQYQGVSGDTYARVYGRFLTTAVI